MYSEDVKKWLETAGYTKPNSFGINDDNKKKVELSINLIQEELDELKKAVATNNNVEILDAIIDLKWVINNFIHFTGATEDILNKISEEVSKSNWSKYCTSHEEAHETLKLYRARQHPDKMGELILAYYSKHEISDDKIIYVIKREHDDKILKSYKYKPVNIKKILNNYGI